MYARCECGAEIGPDGGCHPGMALPECGVLDPAIYGSRCEACGMIEESWGGNLVCPACIAAADEPPYAIATRAADSAIRLTVYDSRWGEHAVALEPKRALLLGADRIRLAVEGELTLEQVQLTLWARFGAR